LVDYDGSESSDAEEEEEEECHEDNSQLIPPKNSRRSYLQAKAQIETFGTQALVSSNRGLMEKSDNAIEHCFCF
jgi:hypothetical protein